MKDPQLTALSLKAVDNRMREEWAAGLADTWDIRNQILEFFVIIIIYYKIYIIYYKIYIYSAYRKRVP